MRSVEHLADLVQGRNLPVLSLAVLKNDQATVAALIEAGADVNARNDVRAVKFVYAALVTTWPLSTLAHRMV
jgi:hypothetical protein